VSKRIKVKALGFKEIDATSLGENPPYMDINILCIFG
jgi:hypothetical protein